MSSLAISAAVAVTAFLIYVAAEAMGIVPSKNHFPVDGKTILLTGGSQGLGRGLGRLFAERGGNVILVARDKEKLRNATEYIKVPGS